MGRNRLRRKIRIRIRIEDIKPVFSRKIPYFSVLAVKTNN